MCRLLRVKISTSETQWVGALTGGCKGTLMADTRRSEAGSCGLYSGDGVDTCACSTTGTLFFALTGMILGYSDEIDGVVKKGRIFSSAKGKHNV